MRTKASVVGRLGVVGLVLMAVTAQSTNLEIKGFGVCLGIAGLAGVIAAVVLYVVGD